MGSNYKISYGVDLVFCIDATQSMEMDHILETVKENALNFYQDFKRVMDAKNKPVARLRVELIAFRDYLADGNQAMMMTDFFELPTHKPARSFSTGQKNQLEVILALSQGADYILMDEPFAGNDVFNREDFYKVLLGILEPNETVLLSTHLLEEVEHFIGRALLLQKGKLVGDVTTLELEEQGKTLMDFVKETYRYKADRVVQALKDLTGEEEP